jgi:hypothetical protein
VLLTAASTPSSGQFSCSHFLHWLRIPQSPPVPCPIYHLRQRATTVRLPSSTPLHSHLHLRLHVLVHDLLFFFPFSSRSLPHIPTTDPLITLRQPDAQSLSCSRGPFLSLTPLCSLDFCLVSPVLALRQISQLCRFRCHEIFSSATSFRVHPPENISCTRCNNSRTLTNTWLLSRVPFATFLSYTFLTSPRISTAGSSFRTILDPKICLITIINNGQPPGSPHGSSRHRRLVLVRWHDRGKELGCIN